MLTSLSVSAQIGVNNPNPDMSSVLDLKSNKQGLLLPRMSTAERQAIVAPADGLLVFDLTDQVYYFYDSTRSTWRGLPPWHFRDDQSDKDLATQLFMRDLTTHSSITAIGIGTQSPTNNTVTVAGNVAVGDITTTADANGLYVKGDLEAQTSVTVTNTLSADEIQGVGTMPVGGIIMWSGNPASLPAEWVVCDGNGGSQINGITIPDLRGRFVVGYDASSSISPADATAKQENYARIGNTGGENAHTLALTEFPQHNHGGNTSTDGAHTHTYTDQYRNTKGVGSFDNKEQGQSSTTTRELTTGDSADHSHTISDQGGGQSHENRPPYYVLAYIIRVE